VCFLEGREIASDGDTLFALGTGRAGKSLDMMVLVAVAAATGTLLVELSAAGLMLVLAMAIGPQLVGHTAINYAARHLRSTLVSVAILGEPVLSAALAWALLGEAIAPLQLLGFAITLCGILCCALDERAR